VTGLLRWETGTYRNWLGYAGTAEHWLFQVSVRACPDNGGRWLLASTLPGQRALAVPGDCDELKAEAERLLRKWASSIGAVLPGPPESLTADGTVCEWSVDDAVSGGSICCGRVSRYRVERPDGGEGYYPGDRPGWEACDIHLAGTVVALMDGDDKMSAIVRVRWDA